MSYWFRFEAGFVSVVEVAVDEEDERGEGVDVGGTLEREGCG